MTNLADSDRSRLPRCLYEGALAPGSRLVLDEDEAHHLVSVRRIHTGDKAIVINGHGTEALARVIATGKRHCEIEVEETRREVPRPVPRILACALTKSGAYDDMIQRAVELGITEFQPLLTERTVVEWPYERGARKLERWRKLAGEALKQCERLWLPDIHEPEEPAPLVSRWRNDGVRMALLAERTPGAPPMTKWGLAAAPHGVALLIGPEGGWSDEEKDHLVAAGAEPATLGSGGILRTETAALAALAQLMAHER